MQRIIFRNRKNHQNSHGFTLVELLIVLTIVAVLGVATVLILNPAEILKKTRDSQRISDLKALKSAIALYVVTFNTPVLGSANSDATCVGGSGSDSLWVSYPSDAPGAAISDASPPAGFTFVQVLTANLGKTDNAGWVPVDLDDTTGGSGLAQLPFDPNHTVAVASVTNADLMYRYTCNYNAAATKPTTFEINAKMESSYYTSGNNNISASDGGNNATLFEVGTNLTLLPGTNDF